MLPLEKIQNPSKSFLGNFNYFSSKIIAQLSGEDLLDVVKVLNNESSLQFSKPSDLSNLIVFQKVLDGFGLFYSVFSSSDFFARKINSEVSLICFQKPKNIIFPDVLMQLPSFCWVRLIPDSCIEDYVLETNPGFFTPVSYSCLKPFWKEEPALFGITITKK